MALSSREIRNRLTAIEQNLAGKSIRSPEEDEILKAIQSGDFFSSGKTAQILQGLQEYGIPSEEITALFGGSDRAKILSDALRSQGQLPEEGRTGFDPPSQYDINLALQRKNIEDYRKRNPLGAFGLQATGVLAPAIITAGRGSGSAIKKAAELALNPKTYKQAVGVGAGLTGLGSFMRGEGGFRNRLSNVPLDVAVSVPFSVSGKFVGDKVGELITRFIKPNPKRLGVQQARDIINDALESDQLTVPQAIEKVMKKIDSEFTLGDVGDNTEALLSALNAMPGVGKKDAATFLRARNEGKINRLYHIFDNVKNGNWIDEYKALQTAMKGKGNKLYSQAYNPKNKNSMLDINAGVEVRGNILSIGEYMGRDDFLSAFKNAQKLNRVRPRAGLKKYNDYTIEIVNGAAVLKNEKGKAVDKIPTQFFQLIKRGYDDLIQSAKRSTEGTTGKELLGGIVANKNELLEIVDVLNPLYKKARDQWAGDASILNAMDIGKAIKSNKYEYSELVKMVSNMSKSEKDAFRIGALNSFIQQIESKGVGGNIAQQIAKSTRDKNLLRLAWGGTDESFNNFWSKLTDEMTVAQTAQSVLGNSKTAVRQTFIDKIKEGGESYRPSSDLTSLILDAVSVSTKDADKVRQKALSKEMARILLTTGKNKAELDTIKKQLQQKMTLEDLIIMYPELITAAAKFPISPAIAALVAQDRENRLGDIPRGSIIGGREALRGLSDVMF